ncbi:SGNH/GDSL hydrolase family protein [Phocaeicola sp.]
MDCVSNLTKDTLIREHTVQAVRQIRNCHKNTPVLIMEHAGYSNSKTNLSRQLECRSANMGTQQAYNDLLVEGVKNIDYISKEDFDFPDDAWVDYVHPSDIGMRQKALVIKSKLLHLCE